MDKINKISSGGTLSKLVLLFFLILYLVFPSGSSTTDGWSYAANIRHAGEIFHPHHLLYNAFGYFVCWLTSKAGIGVLESMKALNAVFAVLIILFVQLILRRLGKKEFCAIIVSCLAGFSFSIMRFATENETYIIPLFFALAASYNFLEFTLSAKQRYAVFSAIWATFSVLFHQLFILWWIGILTGIILSKMRRPVLLYCLISLAGPIIYLFVIFIISGDLKWVTAISFLSGDFPKNAQLGISARGLFLSGANLFRSFLQIHGYILNMIRSNPLFVIPGIISLVYIFLGLFHLPVREKKAGASDFTVVHILIIVMQFVFAVFAFGNAEFMIMIPVLIFMLIPVLFHDSEKFLSRIMTGMAIWNLAYAIVPLHYNHHEAEDFLCNAASGNMQTIVIASDDQLLKSMIYYRTGNNKIENILKSPALMRLKSADMRLLENSLDSALKKGYIIYTDCLKQKIISRSTILEGSINSDFFSKYETAEIKSWESVMGRKVVSRISAKL